MQYQAPRRLQDALSILTMDKRPSIIAGGTDWYPAQGEAPIRCAMLDITRIEGLREIERSGGEWRIGAATTWSDIIQADLPKAFDGLKAAAREVGSVQIQNAGTLAGNLCNASPAADGVPPLLSLQAQVELSSVRGIRRLALGDFIKGPRQIALAGDEMLSAITVPEPSSSRRSGFVKLGARKYLVISIAMVAVTLELEAENIHEARIAVGACSAVAQRLPLLEAALEGQSIAQALQIVAHADLTVLRPIDDVRGTGAYRLDVVASLIARALQEASHE